MTDNPQPHPTVAAVLLAGGESTRMHEMKALLPWTGGEPLIAYQVGAIRDAGYAPIIVVLGHLAGRLREELRGSIPVEVVENPLYRGGRTTSIIAGLEALPPGTAGVLIASVDQPRAAEAYRMLRETWERDRPAIAVPALDGRAGHPPLFDAALLPELLAITEERQGLREVVSRHYGQRLLVPVDDPLTLTNLNTREDYESALVMAQDSWHSYETSENEET